MEYSYVLILLFLVVAFAIKIYAVYVACPGALLECPVWGQCPALHVNKNVLGITNIKVYPVSDLGAVKKTSLLLKSSEAFFILTSVSAVINKNLSF